MIFDYNDFGNLNQVAKEEVRISLRLATWSQSWKNRLILNILIKQFRSTHLKSCLGSVTVIKLWASITQFKSLWKLYKRLTWHQQCFNDIIKSAKLWQNSTPLSPLRKLLNNWRATLKITSSFSQRNAWFLLTLKRNLHDQVFSCVRPKTILHFAVWFVERSNLFLFCSLSDESPEAFASKDV